MLDWEIELSAFNPRVYGEKRTKPYPRPSQGSGGNSPRPGRDTNPMSFSQHLGAQISSNAKHWASGLRRKCQAWSPE